MPETPRSPRRDEKPDNVLKFQRPKPRPGSGPAAGRTPPGRAPDFRRLIAGREGLVGLVLIIALATVLVLWQRLGG